MPGLYNESIHHSQLFFIVIAVYLIYTPRMPNQRGKDQKLLTLQTDAEFIAELNRNLPATGYSNRSQFIRDAIIEKLVLSGIKIPKKLAMVPLRAPISPAGPNFDENSPEEKLADQIEASADKLLKKETSRKRVKRQPQPGASPQSKKQTGQ